MRAPDNKQFYWFSEADWTAIKQSLAGCDVDLDVSMVGQFVPVPGKRWWLADKRYSLRDGLQHIACWYSTGLARKNPPTPTQVAEAYQKMVATLENACDLLARTPFEYDSWYSDDDWDVDGRAYEVMALLIDELKRRIAKLKERIAKRRAERSPRGGNARTPHNDYWRELTRLWQGINGSAGPLRRKELRKFLLACTPPGLFSNMTDTAATERAIDGFFSNLNRGARRPAP